MAADVNPRSAIQAVDFISSPPSVIPWRHHHHHQGGERGSVGQISEGISHLHPGHGLHALLQKVGRRRRDGAQLLHDG